MTFSPHQYKNEWKEREFWRQKIEKSNYKSKIIFNVDDTDVNKMLVSKEEPIGSKEFI